MKATKRERVAMYSSTLLSHLCEATPAEVSLPFLPPPVSGVLSTGIER